MATSRRDTADSYTQRAHREGYPARSVYKLEEIQQANRIIKPGDTVLDVGAAPGSWTLYTHRMLLKGNGTIISVDLNPLNLNPVPPTVTAYVGDAFSKEIREKLTSHGPYDAIISDAAPMTTGNRTVDTTRSEWLAEQVLFLAKEQLQLRDLPDRLGRELIFRPKPTKKARRFLNGIHGQKTLEKPYMRREWSFLANSAGFFGITPSERRA